ncbi:UDP-N-acetylmuramate--L-alanine ligase [Streptomyces albiflavescens]|uniref:UDP-N-acetylmuramate--L-alanine ligase n=1 Tax=Streptomyces albiflavescens TaxID=1623582 RepID=A0A917Y8U0_9ACTN|nr:UDP-N-acetylmuramate--L-alanine ligase [Streptomyces albiflavescens]
MDIGLLPKGKTIHFVGIGGSSMSGLAIMLHRFGYRVSGSDREENANLRAVREAGICSAVGHRSGNVHEDVRLIVSTPAIRKDNPELLAGRTRGLPVVDRGEVLGRIMGGYAQGIAVAGTHGKTTVTSLITAMLTAAGLDPGASVGTAATSDGGNHRMGSGPHFVAEACEYHRNFLHLRPSTAVVLNVKAEHSDYFAGLDDTMDAFRGFVDGIRPGGTLVASADCARARTLTVGPGRQRVSFGAAADADVRAEGLTWDDGRPRFSVTYRGEKLGDLAPRLLGRHNVDNVLAAVAVGHLCGLTLDDMRAGIESFGGAPRRVQGKGTRNGVQVYDDIACHPTEIAATMDAVRGAARGGRILVVLRPNSYVRVRDFMEQYADCFAAGETVVVTDIFAGRDTEEYGVHSRDLVRVMRSAGRDVRYIQDLPGICAFVDEALRAGDTLVTIGPGDIGSVGETWLAGGCDRS